MLSTLDKLLHSLNGKSKTSASSKPLKEAVSSTSEDENFWIETLTIFKIIIQKNLILQLKMCGFVWKE